MRDMKRTFTSLVLGLALLVGGGGVGLAQDYDAGVAAYGRGDYTTAYREFSVLAAQGKAEAQQYLGLMYAGGKGVTQNDEEAVRWYRVAAEQGLATAQGSLASMYNVGLGVNEDLVYAYMWSNISAANGSVLGAAIRDIVAGKMTAVQLATAKKLARQCVAKSYKGC